MAALRAIAKVRSDLGATVGAWYQQRLAQQEVRDKAQGLGDEDHQQRPQQRVHAAALGVGIHVANHQDDDGHDDAAAYADQHQRRHRGYVSFIARQEHQQAELDEGERQNCNCLCYPRDNGEFAAKVRLCLVHRFSPSCSLANASMSEPSNMGCGNASSKPAITIAGNSRNSRIPGSTIAGGSPTCCATQPPNRHHNHAESAEDIAPIQNEIAIRILRDRCSCNCATRACTRACVVATSAELAVTATERSSCPVPSTRAAYSAHSEQSDRCDSTQASSAAVMSSPPRRVTRSMARSCSWFVIGRLLSAQAAAPSRPGRSASLPWQQEFGSISQSPQVSCVPEISALELP